MLTQLMIALLVVMVSHNAVVAVIHFTVFVCLSGASPVAHLTGNVVCLPLSLHILEAFDSKIIELF